MTIRSASLLAAAALAAATAPALAQDRGYDPGPPPPLPAWDDEWEEYPDDEYGDDEDVREHHRDRAGHPGMRGHGPRHPMGYPLEHRAAWLEQCRAAYYDESGRRRGQVIGGLLGAVAGGVAGSEIAEGDDNLGGTLIGAGVGGLAGAAVGGAIGAETDRERIDECEAYLLRHEQSYAGYGHAAGAYGYHYPYPYPVMWVKVPVVTERGDCGCESVVEEWVEEESAPPRIRRVAPRRDKRVRVTK
jgi:hypothetical protein